MKLSVSGYLLNIVDGVKSDPSNPPVENESNSFSPLQRNIQKTKKTKAENSMILIDAEFSLTSLCCSEVVK